MRAGPGLPRRGGFAAACLVAATLLVFGRLAWYPFVAFDDDIHVYENGAVLRGGPVDLAGFWTAPCQRLYIPLTYTALSLENRLAVLSGLGPAVGLDAPAAHLFHAASLATHIGSVLLVLSILLAVGAGTWAAWAGALLFAVHPVQVESVAWVSEFKGLLAGFLALAAIRLWLAARARGDRPPLHVAAAALFALAVLAKPSAVVAALLAPALDFGRPTARSWRWLGLWGLIALAGAVVAKAVQPGDINYATPLLLRPLVFCDAIAVYLGRLLWPAGLGVAYGLPVEELLKTSRPYWTWMVSVLPLLAAWRFKAARRPLAVFVLGLLPVSGLVMFQYQAISTVADRYLYLPMLGPALGLALALDRRPRARTLAACVLVALAVLAGRNATLWRDSQTLFDASLAATPTSVPLHYNRACLLVRLGRHEEAVAGFRETLRLSPTYADAAVNLGNELAGLGRIGEAADAYRLALSVRPDADALAGLGLLEANAGRREQAADLLQKALVLAPSSASIRVNLGSILLALGKPAEAEAALREAVALDPAMPEARINLALALLSKGDKAAAERTLREAMPLFPDRPDMQQAMAGILSSAAGK